MENRENSIVFYSFPVGPAPLLNFSYIKHWRISPDEEFWLEFLLIESILP